MNSLLPKTAYPQSFYIHIPFCQRKCFYCDFAITTGKADLQERYVEVLCQEIKLVAMEVIHQLDQIRDKQSNQLPELKTIFWGGGTPSLLKPRQIGEILNRISQYWAIAPDAEISLEVNPGTVTAQSLKELRSLGINRISLGAQAFQDQLLDLCGRGHGVTEIYEAVTGIKKAGLDNFSLDLISGLPTQTIEQWQESLEQAIALEPKHISVYDLTIEPSTAFGKRYEAGAKPLPTEESTVAMYLMARDRLQTAGYNHYEISNYAVANYQSRHNLTYWHNQPFYGVGMGATSYINQYRFDRPRKMREYTAMVEAWTEGKAPTVPKISDREELFDTLMQGLRLEQGLSLEYLINRFGAAPIQQVLQQIEAYSPHWVNISGEYLSLTQPQGWLFSDEVIGKLFTYFFG
ncbi:putative oxygen-independent coproporphyrinogen III oxidase [Synechococcus sp. PCC 7502]|uniref:radical SAM family heme chaperone HemW n=1 Tax=Synechococcus sp. PCC 7502 TaxID=1173263 RepID=UPI0002A000D5|nr:radical SAM family heme chaperone HemW [Synechococcus sp. PCC 7502]AFY75417.1 putative oxygen-independent coproporphyrinogen III oxidase [Synechococcus sp. PCC 7502]